MLCPLLEEEAGEDLDRVFDRMTFFVRENRIQADLLLCTWTILLPQRAKKWLLQMGYHHQKGHQKYHRKFLHVGDSQGIVEDAAHFTVRTGSLLHLLPKVRCLFCLGFGVCELPVWVKDAARILFHYFYVNFIESFK